MKITDIEVFILSVPDLRQDATYTYVGPGGITWLHRWALTRGVDRSMFAGEPEVPDWVQEIAGLRESSDR